MKNGFSIVLNHCVTAIRNSNYMKEIIRKTWDAIYVLEKLCCIVLKERSFNVYENIIQYDKKSLFISQDLGQNLNAKKMVLEIKELLRIQKN